MIRLLGAAFAVALLVATPAFAHNGVIHLGPINISVPFTRATLPNAPVGGGFFTIENTGTEADRLISATSSVAGDTQIHEMKMEGEVMKMRQLTDGLEIPAGETVVLAPGGYHIMFMGLKQPFVEGETVTVTLTFEKAGTVEVPLPVLGAAADTAPAHDMHQGDATAADHAGMAGMAQPADDKQAIAGLLKGIFETADNPLSIEPIVISGEYAIAGWSQGDAGGRALLRKGADGWAVHLCSGDGLKDAANLVTIGIPEADAASLAADLATAEASLSPELLARFSSFDGTMVVDEDLI